MNSGQYLSGGQSRGYLHLALSMKTLQDVYFLYIMSDATYYPVYMSSFLLLARGTSLFLVFCIPQEPNKAQQVQGQDGAPGSGQSQAQTGRRTH